MKDTLIVLLLISLFIDLWLVLFTATRPDRRRTSPFTMLCCMLMIYTLGYLAELTSATIEGMKASLIVENFAIPNITGLYLLTTLSLFVPKRYRKWHLYVSSAFGFFVFILVLTNAFHNLYYSSISVEVVDGLHFVRLGRGPLYYANQLVVLICFVTSYVIILRRFVGGSRKQRRQMLFFILGAFVSFAGNALNVLNVMPVGVDLLPFALTLALMLFSISILREDLMDVVLRARNIAVETMGNAFIVLDTDADLLYCNALAIEIFPGLQGLSAAEPITKLALWPEELRSLHSKQQESFTLGEGDELRYYSAHVNKIYRHARAQIGYSVSISDITEETQLIAELKTLATTDPLTKIFNRRHFFEAAMRDLEIAKRYNRDTALIMFDLDHFKRINDEYGHLAGDEVLRTMARAVKAELRAYDIFGRVGGEEFLIFTQSSGKDGLICFADRLRAMFEALEVESEGNIIKFTASFGICLIAPGGNLSEAMTRVDQSLYRAKSEGRNRVCMDESCPVPLSGDSEYCKRAEDRRMFTEN